MKEKRKKIATAATVIFLIVVVSMASGVVVYGNYQLEDEEVSHILYENLLYELEPEPFYLSVDESLKGGSIKLNKEEALLGDVISVSVSADKNKRLVPGSIRVNLANTSKRAASVQNSSFSMPYAPVEVSCRFENTLDGIYLDPASLLHGKVHLWKDDNSIVHVGTSPYRGYEVETVFVSDNPTDGSNNKYSFFKDEDIDVTVLVTWNPITYSVNYDANGGELIADDSTVSSYTISSSAYMLPEASRVGYNFVGWVEQSKKNKALKSILPSTSGDLNYIAKWEAENYSITYENVPGASFYKPASYTTEQTVSLPLPSKKGYKFCGWYENSLFEGESISNIQRGDVGNKKYYAKWEPVLYSVAYDLKNGFFTEKNDLTSYIISDVSYKLPVPEKTGYKFLGWTKLNDVKKTISEIPAGSTENLYLTANWEPINYSIQYKNVDSLAGEIPASYCVEDFVILPRPEKEDYIFEGWHDSSSSKAVPLYAIQKGSFGNKILYASWTPKEYPINLHLFTLDNLKKDDVILYTKEDSDIVLSNPSDKRWTFVGWYDDENLEKKSKALVPHGSSGERDYYAKWNCTITFDSMGGNECSSQNVTNKDPYLESLPLSSREFYDFDGWFLDKNCTNRFTTDTEILGNTVLYAKWNPVSYSITYNVNGGEMPSNYMKEYTVETNQSSLPVPKKNGWAFGGWFADSSFKTPVENALHSDNIADDVYFSRHMNEETSSDSFLNKNMMQTGMLSGNSLFNTNKKEAAKIEKNSDVTLYAKWFKFDVCNIPAGSYLASEQTMAVESIPYDLEVAKTEITRGTYKMIMGYDPSDDSCSSFADEEEKMQNPVQMVSWFDALVFCNKLSMLNGFEPVYVIDGSSNPDDWGNVPCNNDLVWSAVTCVEGANGYRLPTEKEWMWSAMSGPLSVGDVNASGINVNGVKKEYAGQKLGSSKKSEKNIKNFAWFSSNSKTKTHPVGLTEPNEAGLYDMSGNVWELCWDAYEPSEAEVEAAKKDNSTLYSGVFYRPIRGGSWYSFPSLVSISSRMPLNIYGRNTITGFRVVRTIKK